MWCFPFSVSREVLQSIARAPHPITYERRGREDDATEYHGCFVTYP